MFWYIKVQHFNIRFLCGSKSTRSLECYLFFHYDFEQINCGYEFRLQCTAILGSISAITIFMLSQRTTLLVFSFIDFSKFHISFIYIDIKSSQLTASLKKLLSFWTTYKNNVNFRSYSVLLRNNTSFKTCRSFHPNHAVQHVVSELHWKKKSSKPSRNKKLKQQPRVIFDRESVRTINERSRLASLIYCWFKVLTNILYEQVKTTYFSFTHCDRREILRRAIICSQH